MKPLVGRQTQLETPWLAPNDELTVATWNVGYGGLGQASDFVTDGGSHWFPPSRRVVRENVDAIATWLAHAPVDVLLVQEMATAGLANYWVNLRGLVESRLARRSHDFVADLSSRLPFWPMRIEHGNATYAKPKVADVEVWKLPGDGDAPTGGLRRHYSALVSSLPIMGESGVWRLANLHLAAFDPHADLRRRQVTELFRLAETAYSRGDYVVLGGDWNLRLAETAFAHRTDPRHLTWLADFPMEILPNGWAIVCDPTIPSVRTNDRPYEPGENYTGVIDGFIVSPNVESVAVHGVDLRFRHTDHQPVCATFRRRGPT